MRVCVCVCTKRKGLLKDTLVVEKGTENCMFLLCLPVLSGG